MSTVLPIARQRSKEVHLRIGDLARLAEKSTRAVRLYEEMGLLGAVVRTEGGHRLYGEGALIRMSWIDKLQLLGFSLPQIRELLNELEDAEKGPAAMSKIRDIFRAKLEDTKAQLAAMKALVGELEDSLQYLESCNVCEPTTLLSACTVCEHPHAVEPPTLISGIHTCGHKESEST
ncbi:MerR family transcriptional regulator [Myxococcota bacterium]|nr:MerR family transcriptional regulator [Myxococcota bacterium]